MVGRATGLIFISYAHKGGGALAQRLSTDLSSNHYRTWFDRSRLRPGATWSADIEQALNECDILLAVLSAGSVTSDICRAEVLRALRHGKRVIPLALGDTVDPPIFLETKQYISFAPTRPYEDAMLELAAALASSEQPSLAAKYRDTYVTAPRLPANLVPRPGEVDALRSRVLREERQATIAIVAVIGMGGVGKSTLVQMLCHDSSVQAAFPDGVIWVSLGREVTDLVPKMREVGKSLGDDLARYDTPDGASNQLRTFLRRKTALVVLDDVWQIAQVKPFLADAPHSCLLVTTRMQDIATSLQALRVEVGTLSVGQSLDVLARWTATAPSDLPSEAVAIVRACGRLPLALAMIGGLVRGRIHDGRLDAWAAALYNLETAQLDRIRFPLEDYQYPELQRAIQVSVDVLDSESRRRYLGMCVFPEDTAVPERVFETLWQVNRFEVQQTVDTWIRASLARRVDDSTIVIHDLQLDYLRRLAADDIAGLHQQLVDRYAEARGGEWPAGENDGYFYQRVTWHLAEARNRPALADLLLNPTFIRAKLDTLSYADLWQDFRWTESCCAVLAPQDQELLRRLEGEVRDLRTFVDRTKESAVVERWFTSDDGSFLAVVGQAGIGKSWFMRNVWVRNCHRSVFHRVDLSRGSRDSCRELISALVRSVGDQSDSLDTALDLTALDSVVRDVVVGSVAPPYVLVDGLDEPDWLSSGGLREPLECFRQLASTGIRFVLSSRIGTLADELAAELPGISQLHLRGMPHEVAKTLLLQLIKDAPSTVEADALEQLVQRADGSPLVVSLIAAALKEGSHPAALLQPTDLMYLVERVLRRLAESPPIRTNLHAVLRALADSRSDIFIEDVLQDPDAAASTIDALQLSALFEVREDHGRHNLRAVNHDLLALLRDYYQREGEAPSHQSSGD